MASTLVEKNGIPQFILTAEKQDSISKAWKALYADLDGLKRELTYTQGLEPYMRRGYSELLTHKKIV